MLGFPRVVHVIQETRVVEIKRGPDISLQCYVPVEEPIPEHVEADPRDVEAKDEEWELLTLRPGEAEQVTGEGEHLGRGDQVHSLHQSEDADTPEVSAGVCSLEPDGLPV